MCGFHGMGFGFGWIIGIAILVLVVWGIVRIVANCHNSEANDNQSALDVLKKRFASGEISREEYEEMMRIIS